MNGYMYADLQLGMEETFTYSITEESMELFFNMTGDMNPLHCSCSYAAEHGFSGRVVYGMLSAALVST